MSLELTKGIIIDNILCFFHCLLIGIQYTWIQRHHHSVISVMRNLFFSNKKSKTGKQSISHRVEGGIYSCLLVKTLKNLGGQKIFVLKKSEGNSFIHVYEHKWFSDCSSRSVTNLT